MPQGSAESENKGFGAAVYGVATLRNNGNVEAMLMIVPEPRFTNPGATGMRQPCQCLNIKRDHSTHVGGVRIQ
jgi:hypothetical protein